jgi:hypothetical protein
MNILVNDKLLYSLNHSKKDITGKSGTVIHKLPDNYWLIEFDDIWINDRKGRTFLLQWYVHKSDLKIC